MDGRKERRSAFRIASRNSSPSLEMQKGVLHQVPQFVELFVILSLLFPVLSRRNLCLHALLYRLLNNRVAVVPLVRQQILCGHSLDEFASLRAICCGTCRDKYSDRHTMRIHGQVQLCIEPPFVRPIS